MLTSLQENYGRAKETHAHTQALWEKEIRRARKENFKAQSSTVKLQEELKSSRAKVKSIEESLEREKERSRVREQEAFTARYQIVGVQEQLEQALERIKVVEQERDAFKTAAQNEEVARIAAEGRIPLPKTESPEDEFASPKKPKQKLLKPKALQHARVSLSGMEILSSEASELEIEELRFQLEAERSRSARAQEMVDFLQAECQMRTCACSKSKSRASTKLPEEEHHNSVIVHEPVADEMHIDEDEEELEEMQRAKTPEEEVEDLHVSKLGVAPVFEARSPPGSPAPDSPYRRNAELLRPISKKEPRRSTIFCPKEGIFRTVSEQEAEALEIAQAEEERMAAQAAQEIHMTNDLDLEPDLEVDEEEERHPRLFARTPSVEPPAFAMLAQQRTSLLSLLNAPTGEAHSAPPSMHNIPTMPATEHEDPSAEEEIEDEPLPRPHTSSATYSVTTTRVPVRDEADQLNSSFGEKLRTPSGASNASFDLNNPALTPTMTREEALAKIRERRGRARSVEKKTTGAAATAHKKMSADRVDRRTVSGLARKPSKGR